MSREKDTMINELTLLKLARWTNSLNFKNDIVRVPFANLVCYAVYEICSSLSVWVEFVNTLHADTEFVMSRDRINAELCTKVVKKRFFVRKNFFFIRITYKYLLMAEVCYIFALFKKAIKVELIVELCHWFSITKNGEKSIIQYTKNHLDPQWMIQSKKMKKFNGIMETIPLFSIFAQKENAYYRLPRKNVSMFSTMSSGKSTFVNALLGHDYLPSKNEACTAKVVSISDIDHIEYCLGYAIKKGKYDFCGDVDQGKLLEWNNDPKVSDIILEGNLDRISSKDRVIVIHDKPGVNYSGNEEHKRITLTHLVKSRPNIIICLLDAMQMLTTDFSDSLEELKKANVKGSNAEVYFVINKADSYDSKKESLNNTIKDVLAELKKHGFENPVIIPVSAQAARLFKMALHGRTEFSENEIDDFAHYLRFFSRSENNFTLLAIGVPMGEMQNNHYSSKGGPEITIEGKSYDRDKITDALFYTGIPVVENILNIHRRKI
jgi:ribosome biogenesis GTPase A